jgi:hypothetical protein
MDRKELPLEPRQLLVPLGSIKMISEPMVCLALTMHLSCTDTNTVSTLQTHRNEIPHDARHLSVPSGASKIIFEPMVRSAQTVHLSCSDTNTVSEQTETSFHLSLVTLEHHRVHLK